MTKLAFVCTGNAGRSQLAAGLAERERDRRQLAVEVVTGGIDPADRVYDDVRRALLELDVDIGDRQPRRIGSDDLADADIVATIGCSVDELLPDGFAGEVRPLTVAADGDSLPGVRAQRSELEEQVSALFDELEASIDR